MDLYLIRHAPALPDSPTGDRGRALSPRGRRRFEDVCHALRQLGVRLDQIWTSPWLRAAQTAQMLAPLAAQAPRETDLLAAPPSRALLERLSGESVALVGHEPWMSELLGQLISDGDRWAEGVRLGKGSVAHLVGEPVRAGMVLRSLLPMRTVRGLCPAPDRTRNET